MIYQHITGRKPISLECAIAYAIGLDKPLSAISPRLAEVVQRIPKEIEPYQPAKATRLSVNESSNVSLFPPRDFSPTTLEIAKIADTMNRDGQLMLLGQAQLLSSQHPRNKANSAE